MVCIRLYPKFGFLCSYNYARMPGVVFIRYRNEKLQPLLHMIRGSYYIICGINKKVHHLLSCIKNLIYSNNVVVQCMRFKASGRKMSYEENYASCFYHSCMTRKRYDSDQSTSPVRVDKKGRSDKKISKKKREKKKKRHHAEETESENDWTEVPPSSRREGCERSRHKHSLKRERSLSPQRRRRRHSSSSESNEKVWAETSTKKSKENRSTDSHHHHHHHHKHHSHHRHRQTDRNR